MGENSQWCGLSWWKLLLNFIFYNFRYECVCPKGYRGDRCEVKIDYCETKPCGAGSTCVSKIGSYQCLCQPGWVHWTFFYTCISARGEYFREFNPLLFAKMSLPQTKIRPNHSEGVVWAQNKGHFWTRHHWKPLYILLSMNLNCLIFYFLEQSA